MLALALAAFAAALAPAQSALPPAAGSQAASPAAVASFAELLRPPAELARIGALPSPLPLAELVRASLLASGIEATRVPAYETRVSALLDAVEAQVAGIAEPAAKAEEALRQLHDRALKRYVANATTMQELLDSGAYNCVSSAVLYLLAMRRIGIEAYGVRTVEHALCVVRLPVGAAYREIDVETTNRNGFDPGSKKEFLDSFGRVTGYSYVPPQDYARRAGIGEKTLVGLILSNRSALLEGRGRYRDSLVLGSELAALQADREGRDFLLDRLNNLAADLSRRNDHAGVAALAAAAESALGPEPRVLVLRDLAAYNQAAVLGQAGRYAEAFEAALALRLALEAQPLAAPAGSATGAAPAGGAAARYGAASGTSAGPSRADILSLYEASAGNLVSARLRAKAFAEARADLARAEPYLASKTAVEYRARIADAELTAILQTRPFAEGRAAAERALSEGLPRSRYEEAVVYLYGTEANRVGNSGDWLGAAALAREGLALIPRNANLSRALQGYERNFVAEAHNRFAALFNRKAYREALAVAEEALRQRPEDRSLQEDRALAKKALGE